MSPEQQPRPQPPEHEQEQRTPVFDLRQLSAEAIVMLNQLIDREALKLDKAVTRSRYSGSSPDQSDIAEAERWLEAATELQEAYGRDLEGSLIEADVDKAREAILALAQSDYIEDRAMAGSALGPLLKREYELGSENATEDADLLIQLLHDEAEPPYLDTAAGSMSQAVEQGWLPPDVAERFRRELAE
jgi:hypothetical protein